MFKGLSDRVTGVFDRLTGKGALTEADIDIAMREIRIALLEADVSLPVAKDFIATTKERIVGAEIAKSISPAQMVIKLVQDQLTDMLGGENQELNFNTEPPAVIMIVGLQGSGKTTSSAKLAHHLKRNKNKKILLASLDIYRPAAQKQLEVLAQDNDLTSIEIIESEKPEKITERALKQGKLEGFDIVILDTAGRLHINAEMMDELTRIKNIANPIETLLVADSLTGQDAVNIAKEFHEKLELTGIVLTRVDGDSRGGAALSMKSVTGCPIKFMGLGEKIDQFQGFYPERIASRILDKGDVVSLVEKAVEDVDKDKAAEMERKFRKGKFDLNDMAEQFKQMEKMGGFGGIMNLLPGMGKMQTKFKDKLNEAGANTKIITHQMAVISSMTPKERANPKLLNGSRKIRISGGCGLQVQDVNKLLKQFKQMSTVIKKMKKMGKGGKLKMMRELKNMMGDGGNSPF